jgi:hypothetical protein
LVIRISESQLTLLQQNQAGARGEPAPAVVPVRRRREDLPENQLESQIRGFLNWRGFVTLRLHVGAFLPLRFARQLHGGQISLEQALRNVVQINEQGAADWLSIRPTIRPSARAQDGPWPWEGFFWECKAPGKRPSPAQLAWLDKRRQCGFEAAWFNQFAAADRPSPACEPRESHVFETWFCNYFSSCRSE